VLNADLADPPLPECQLSAWRTTMRKLIIAAVAAASLLTAASAANAGWIATTSGWVYYPYTYTYTYYPYPYSYSNCYYDIFGVLWCY
jgi:1,4-dihydroxy-2-naphthoate octaprenyltransferase